ncbi:MAG TPA: hypothetical protein V6C90_10200 [Coleofasciculaceae cyanobacterium]
MGFIYWNQHTSGAMDATASRFANASALPATTKATQAPRKHIDIVNTHTYTLGMDVYFVLNSHCLLMQHPKWQQRWANLPLLSQHEELSQYER